MIHTGTKVWVTDDLGVTLEGTIERYNEGLAPFFDPFVTVYLSNGEFVVIHQEDFNKRMGVLDDSSTTN